MQNFWTKYEKEEGKKIFAYNRFKTSLGMLEQRMAFLPMPENRKYDILTKLVKGKKLDCIYLDNPRVQTEASKNHW